MGYEVEFAPGTFNAADWIDKTKAPGLITMGVPTMSPSEESVQGLPAADVHPGLRQSSPEPDTPWLLGVGAISLLWFARRRRDSGVGFDRPADLLLNECAGD